jgi:hypothetical protein
VFFAAPQWWFPDGDLRELAWSGWEQAIGSAYVFFAAVLLVYAAVGLPRVAVSRTHEAVASVS